MKRKTLIKVVTSLAIALTCTVFGGLKSVQAAGIGLGQEIELEAILEEERALYENDPMFYMDAEEQGYTFEEFLLLKALRVLQSRNSLTVPGDGSEAGVDSVGNNGQNLYANVPLIQQPNSYTCGPTSALQALYGLGRQNYVSGSTDSDKINTLATNSATTSTSGTMVYQLVNTLNLYTPSYGSYEYVLGSNLTEAQFQSRVENSLWMDFAPILHAKTEYLDYYGGHPSGHYIVISELDRTNAKIRVQDCNYDNAYYGTHAEPITKFYNSIHTPSSRYLICRE